MITYLFIFAFYTFRQQDIRLLVNLTLYWYCSFFIVYYWILLAFAFCVCLFNGERRSSLMNLQMILQFKRSRRGPNVIGIRWLGAWDLLARVAIAGRSISNCSVTSVQLVFLLYAYLYCLRLVTSVAATIKRW